jgi:bifunctional DNase/RNase
VLVLEHRDSERAFPIWLHDADAAAVARALDGRGAVSPDAHTLTFGVVAAVGARVEHAMLTGVVGGVVQARVMLRYGDETVGLDARSSDAIALAVRARAPILVGDALLDQVAARVREAEARLLPATRSDAAESVEMTPGERWNQLLQHLGGDGDGPLYEA